MEFPADAADVESLPGVGDGKYRRPEAGDVHATERAAVCRDLRGGRAAGGSVERRYRAGSYGQLASWAQRRRQGGLYWIHRGQADYYTCHAKKVLLRCFDAVGWAAGRASGL